MTVLDILRSVCAIVAVIVAVTLVILAVANRGQK